MTQAEPILMTAALPPPSELFVEGQVMISQSANRHIVGLASLPLPDYEEEQEDDK